MTSLDTLTQVENIVMSCRTCLCVASDNMFDIFAKIDDSNAAEMLSFCTSIKVTKEDNLPKKLCDNCYKCIISFYQFRKLAEEIDAKLHNNSLENNPHENLQITYKQEFTEIKCEIEGAEMNLDYDNLDYDFKREKESEGHMSDLVLHDIKKHDLEIQGSSKALVEIDIKFTCDICCEDFNTHRKLKYHKLKHETDCHTCNFCLKTFERKSKFIKHLLLHSKDKTNTYLSELDQNKDQRFKCDVCSLKYKSINSLSAHKRKHITKGRILSCSLCGKIFKKLSHLKRHELVHEDNRPYKCLLCPKSFASEAVLTEHVDKHNGIKPHKCPVCSKTFSHMSTLNTHLKIHKKEKSYLCPTCGKRFDSSNNLKQHLNRHLGIKMFECHLCPRTFVSKGELKSHIITHTGERAHTCDQCGTKFTKGSSLRKHKLVHLGIKPHQCNTCFMKFTSKDHLKRHCRIHTGEKPYLCDICDRAFTQSNDLVKHRRAHLGDKLYKCTQCTDSFRLQVELRQHISEHFITSKFAALNTSDKQTNVNVICNEQVGVEQSALSNERVIQDRVVVKSENDIETA